MKRVEFFYDLSSPYSYLGATQINALAERCGAEAVWKPFVLGAVFKATGNVAPATVAAKALGMYKDLTRWAQHYGVPFQMSSRFPVNAMKAMRLCVAAERDGKGKEMGRACFDALWVKDLDITDDGVLKEICTKVGVDPEKSVAACEDPAIKLKLREYTEDAVKRGAYGAPTFFVGSELFWGNDRLHFVEAELRK
jgi:2-hydroxychromene-2-carboxylate isomerase